MNYTLRGYQGGYEPDSESHHETIEEAIDAVRKSGAYIDDIEIYQTPVLVDIRAYVGPAGFSRGKLLRNT
jgi:hypothetical protein